MRSLRHLTLGIAAAGVLAGAFATAVPAVAKTITIRIERYINHNLPTAANQDPKHYQRPNNSHRSSSFIRCGRSFTINSIEADPQFASEGARTDSVEVKRDYKRTKKKSVKRECVQTHSA